MSDYSGPLTQARGDGAAPAAYAPDAALSNEFTIPQATLRAASDINSAPLSGRETLSAADWPRLNRPRLFASKTTDLGTQRITNFKSVFSLLAARSLCRGQSGVGGTEEIWENAVAGGVIGCSYTFFPVIGRVSLGDGTNRPQWTAFLYCALYSRLAPPSGENGVIHHQPQYTDIQTTGDGSGTIRVDMTHVGDQNAWLSIFSALQNTRAMNGYHLTLFPVVEDGVFHERIQRDGRHAWAIKGPSLGLSVAMAVLGGAPVMYTGYLKALFPNGTTDEQMSRVYPKFRQPDVPGATMPYPDQGARVLSGQIASYSTAERPLRYGAPGYAVSTIMENLNYVETVHFLPQKVQLALTIAMPIVVPYYNSMGERMETLIRSRNFVQTAFIIKMHARTYTCADAQDGRSVTSLAPNIFIAATLAEASILGAYACTAYYKIDGLSTISREQYVKNTEDAAAPAIEFANTQREKILTRERENAASAAQVRKKMKEIGELPPDKQDEELRKYLFEKDDVSFAKTMERRQKAERAAATREATKAAALAQRVKERRDKIAKMKLKYAKGEKKALFGQPKPGVRATAAKALLRNDELTRAGMAKRTVRSAKQLANLGKVPGEASRAKAAAKAADARKSRQAAALDELLGTAPPPPPQFVDEDVAK